MAVTVKPKQIVRAKNTDAAVFTDYKGAGLQKIAYTATKKGDSLGEATGNSFPGTGVDFDWIELIYIIQTSFIFGLPTFERKLGYVPSIDVYFEEPVSSTVGTGSTTNPSSGGSTTPAPTQGGQNSNVTTSSATDKVIHKKGGLPRWAIWSLAGLGVVSVFLVGYLASNKKKTQKK